VPLEQQPVNEYEALKAAWPFAWAELSPLPFAQKLLWVAFWGSLLASPIAAASFPPQKKPIFFVLATALGIFFLLGLFLIRLLLGWFYIKERLQAEEVIYEESGWYDGQRWPKPVEILTRDLLILRYQVQPLLQRLQKTLLILGALMVLDVGLWSLLGFYQGLGQPALQ
jgi:hypothetical protein